MAPGCSAWLDHFDNVVIRIDKTGLRSYTLRRWTVNEGSYGLRVNYSDQTVTIE